jgi:hypothetical protein
MEIKYKTCIVRQQGGHKCCLLTLNLSRREVALEHLREILRPRGFSSLLYRAFREASIAEHRQN